MRFIVAASLFGVLLVATPAGAAFRQVFYSCLLTQIGVDPTTANSDGTTICNADTSLKTLKRGLKTCQSKRSSNKTIRKSFKGLSLCLIAYRKSVAKICQKQTSVVAALTQCEATAYSCDQCSEPVRGLIPALLQKILTAMARRYAKKGCYALTTCQALNIPATTTTAPVAIATATAPTSPAATTATTVGSTATTATTTTGTTASTSTSTTASG